MGTFQDIVDFAWRNWVTDGVPATGANNPKKGDIRVLGPALDSAFGLVNAQFVGLSSGVRPKQAVSVAVFANVDLTAGLTAGTVINGVTLTTGMRVAPLGQTTGSTFTDTVGPYPGRTNSPANGVYVIGAGAAVRATDMDTGVEMPGATFYASGGTVGKGATWRCSAPDPVTLGTTGLLFILADEQVTAVPATLDSLRGVGATITGGPTINLAAATGDYVAVTVTGGNLTGLGSGSAGMERTVRFTAAATLVHSAALLCPLGVNWNVKANDVVTFRCVSASNWVATTSISQTSADDLVPRIDALEELVPSFVLGVSAALVLGTGHSGAGTFVHASPVAVAGVFNKFECYAGTNGYTVTPAVFSKVGDVFTVLRSAAPVIVMAGLNTLYISLDVNPGEYVGVTGSGSGWSTYNSVVSTTPYYNGTLSGGSFTDTSPTGSFEVQYRFTIVIADADEAVREATLPTRHIGKEGVPAAGAINGGSGTLVFGQVDEDGLWTKYEYWPRVASTATLGVFSRNSDGLTTRLRIVGDIAAIPGQLNTLTLSVPVSAGEWLGVTGSVSGWCGATSVGGNLSETPYFIGTLVGEQFTTLAQSTNTTFEVRFTVTTKGETHLINLANSDKVIVVGQSFEYGAYNPKGKSWANNASPWSPYQWEVFPQGGSTVAQILTSLKARASTYGRAYLDMKPTITVIDMGKNDAIDSPTPTTLANFLSGLRELVMFCQSVGSKVIVRTELDLLYAPGGALAWRKVAEDLGCEFIHAYNHRKNMAATPAYAGFFQGTALSAPNGWHPGVRANYMIVNAVLNAVEKFGRPLSSVKYFRKRESITVATVADLLHTDEYTRNERFKEIEIGHRRLNDNRVGYVDAVNIPAATDGIGSAETTALQMSERFLFSRGDTLDLGTHALVEIVLPASAAKTQYVTMTLSDPNVLVYVLDFRATPRGWTAVGVSNGMVRLGSYGLQGRLRGEDGDTLSLLLVKSSGIVITEPKIRVATTDTGKLDRRIRANRPKARGAELLANTSVATAGVLTGWTAGGGATVNTAPVFVLPPGSTGVVEVSTTKYVEQALTFTADSVNDREIVIRCKAGRWPAIPADPTINTGMSIDHDTFDCRKLQMTLIDSGGQQFMLSGVVGLWWNWIEVRAMIPLDLTALTLRISANDVSVYIDQASVKFVD